MSQLKNKIFLHATQKVRGILHFKLVHRGCIIILIGVFIALILNNIILIWNEDLSQESITILFLRVLLSSLIGKGFWISVLLIVFILTYFFIYQSPDTKVNLRTPMNYCIYLYVLNFFLPIFRSSLVAIPLITMILLTPAKSRKSKHNVKWFILVFVTLTLIQMWSAWVGLDNVWPTVPKKSYYQGILMFFHAILIYYVVKRNEWGIKEFDTIFKWILIFGALISIESLITFYAGFGTNVNIFGEAPLTYFGTFQSIFVMSYHEVGRIAMTMIFISLYFFASYRNPKYIVTFILGFLLLTSTLNRQVIIATLLGLAMIFVLRRNLIARRYVSRKILNIVLYQLLFCVLVFSFIISTEVIATYRGAGGLFDRTIKLIRGLDVMIYTKGLGTGGGSTVIPYYLSSLFVPPTASNIILPYLGMDFNSALRHIEREIRGEVFAYTLHNFWFEVIVGWGVVGLVALFYLFYWVWKLFWKVFTFEKMGCAVNDTRPVWIVFALVFSVSISVLFTSKFQHVWYFVILFLFLEKCVQKVLPSAIGNFFSNKK